MTTDRKRKHAIRDHAARTGQTYQQALRAANLERADHQPRLMLPLHAPYTGPARCPTCTGTGVLAGATIDLAPGDATNTIVCHIFCPRCSGCGRARHTHCLTGQHAQPEAIGLDPAAWDDDDEDPDEDPDDAEQCYSCHDRRWWPMQAFDENTIYDVRVPCGCSTDLLVPAPAATP
jgi:hypothetical protein